jgi:hypothetical protein
MSCIGFSQNLKPTVYTIQNDTLFCFTVSQAKVIAIELEGKKYLDSITVEQNTQLALQDSLIQQQDSTLKLLHNQAINYQCIITNSKEVNNEVNLQLGYLKTEVKRHKRDKIFLGTGLGVSIGIIGILTILN